jgi:hypothetical protein
MTGNVFAWAGNTIAGAASRRRIGGSDSRVTVASAKTAPANPLELVIRVREMSRELGGSIPISFTRKPLSNQRLAVSFCRIDAPRRGR